MCSSREFQSKRERASILYNNFNNHYLTKASPTFTSIVCHKRRRGSCRHFDAELHLCAVIDFSICHCNREETNALVRLAESDQLVLLVAELNVVARCVLWLYDYSSFVTIFLMAANDGRTS
jgi:hypothetical protein